MKWLVPSVDDGRPPVYRALLRAAQSAMYASGAGAMFVRARSVQGALILMYHGVVGADDEAWVDPRYSVSVAVFHEQMQFLKRHRHVMSMTELVDRIEHKSAIPSGTVVVTFDDGYKSTLDVAAPILQRYDLPAVVYLATGYVSRGQTQFVDTLFSTFRGRTRHAVNFADDDLDLTGDLRNVEVERRVYLALARRLMVSTFAERERLLDEVIGQLLPRDRAPRLTLTWEEVHRLRKAHPRMEIGTHTRNHIDLTSCTPSMAASEVADSLEDLQRELGAASAHFSFPFGRSNGLARSAAAAAKVRSAAVTEPATLARSGADLLGLSRMSACETMRLFPFYTSGAYPDLSHKLLGRA